MFIQQIFAGLLPVPGPGSAVRMPQWLRAARSLPCGRREAHGGRQKRIGSLHRDFFGNNNGKEKFKRAREEMATHSSILAWRILWMGEPGRLQSLVSQRVGHNLATTHTHTHRSKRASQMCLKKRPELDFGY